MYLRYCRLYLSAWLSTLITEWGDPAGSKGARSHKRLRMQARERESAKPQEEGAAIKGRTEAIRTVGPTLTEELKTKLGDN
jgi:hypothetical protein